MFEAVKALFRAVMWGSLTGAFPFLCLTVPLSFTSWVISSTSWREGVPSAFAIAILPLFVALMVVVPAMVCIGLPVTAALKKLHKESPKRYAYLGAATGFFLPVIAISLDLGDAGAALEMFSWCLMFGVLGMVSGFASGLSWGKWRMRLAQVPSVE